MPSTISWCIFIVSAVSICSLTRGAPVDCNERCVFGFEKDENGKEFCQCHDPCDDVRCGENQVCYPQYELCIHGYPCPPPPVGVCVPDTVSVPSIRYKRGLFSREARRLRRSRPRNPGPRTPPHDPRPRSPRWP